MNKTISPRNGCVMRSSEVMGRQQKLLMKLSRASLSTVKLFVDFEFSGLVLFLCLPAHEHIRRI